MILLSGISEGIRGDKDSSHLRKRIEFPIIEFYVAGFSFLATKQEHKRFGR